MPSSAAQRHIREIPQNTYVQSNGMKYDYNITPSRSTKPSYLYMSMRMIVISVLLYIVSISFTVALSYRWSTDNNKQIEELAGTMNDVLRDLNIFSNMVRNELAAKHVNNHFINKEKSGSKNILFDNLDVGEDYGADRFMMGKQLLKNNWQAKNYKVHESHKSKTRHLRSADFVDISSTNIIKKEHLSSNNAKSNVDLIQDGNYKENNTLKSFNQSNTNTFKSLRKTTIDQKNENSIQTLDAAAAHFTIDPSKHTIGTKAHNHGNRQSKHSGGGYQNWTPLFRNTIYNNSNGFKLKHGKVEVSKEGLYYVYAQISYYNEHKIKGHYIVMRNHEIILDCSVVLEAHSESCYTGGLVYIRAKDSISIKVLDGDRFLILDQAMSFFGLFIVSLIDNEA